jgi:hypothetical protein
VAHARKITVVDQGTCGKVTVEEPALSASYELWGCAPVQALGTVLERDMYFRARHDGWTFDVADRNGHLPSDGYKESDGFYREATYPNAGFIAHAEAIEIIERCLVDYRKERG